MILAPLPHMHIRLDPDNETRVRFSAAKTKCSSRKAANRIIRDAYKLIDIANKKKTK